MFKGSIAIRLGAWFLVLSIFPLTILTVFVLNKVESSLNELVLDRELNQVQIIAAILSKSAPAKNVEALRTIRFDTSDHLYIIDLDGQYLISLDDQRTSVNIQNDFSPQIAEQILSGTTNAILDGPKGRVISFSPVIGQQYILLIVDDNSYSRELLNSIRLSIQTQLGAGLLISAIVGGIAIWLVIGKPIRQFTHVAQLIGQGNLETRLDPEDSVDELNTLAHTVNKMTSQLKETIDALNQRILEQQQTEEALRESEQRQRDLLNNTSSVIYIKDLEGRYIFINQMYEKLFHVSDEELKGKTDNEIFPPELVESLRANDLKVIKEGKPLEFEENIPLEDGEHIYISVKFPLKHSSGEAYAVCGISTDITRRKQAEIERENLISELEAKNTELTQFTYTVSHDLKSPLVTINGYLGYIEQDATSGNTERLKKDIQRIEEATHKMHALLTELLELSRIGRMMNEPQSIPFQDIINEALELIHGQIEKSQVTVQTQPNLPVVHGDRQRLTEIVQNLIENATKHMGNQTDPLIKIGQQGNEDGKTVFFIKDNGIGIAPEYHERIFGLFNKLDAQSEGTGIGLTLVKRIVEFHGGRIWVESAEGEGSTFFFTLPGAQQ